jgi:uncharacterized membrane protein
MPVDEAFSIKKMISVLLRLCCCFLSIFSLSSACLHQGTSAFLSYFLLFFRSCFCISRARNNGEKGVPCTKIHLQIKGKGIDAHGTSSLRVLYDTSKLNLIHTNPLCNTHKHM